MACVPSPRSLRRWPLLAFHTSPKSGRIRCQRQAGRTARCQQAKIEDQGLHMCLCLKARELMECLCLDFPAKRRAHLIWGPGHTNWNECANCRLWRFRVPDKLSLSHSTTRHIQNQPNHSLSPKAPFASYKQSQEELSKPSSLLPTNIVLYLEDHFF